MSSKHETPLALSPNLPGASVSVEILRVCVRSNADSYPSLVERLRQCMGRLDDRMAMKAEVWHPLFNLITVQSSARPLLESVYGLVLDILRCLSHLIVDPCILPSEEYQPT